MALYSPSNYRSDRLSMLQRVVGGSGSVFKGLILRCALNGNPGLAEWICIWASWCVRRDYVFYGWRAVFAWAREDAKAAEECCAGAIRRFPRKWRLRWLLASLVEEQKDPERALAVLGEACPENESGVLLALRVRLHVKRGELETAITLATIARERFPNVLWPSTMLARSLYQLGHFQRAQELADKAIGEFPESPYFSYLQATLARARRDYAEAYRREIACLQAHPGHHPTMRMLLQSLNLSAELDAEAGACLDAYRQIARRRPADYGVLRRIADLQDVDPDVDAISQVAYSQEAGGGALFDSVLARASLDDFPGVARGLRDLLDAGSWDQRLVAFLRIYGARLAPHLEPAGLPGIEFLEEKFKTVGEGSYLVKEEQRRMDAVSRFLPGPESACVDDTLVSFICPIHRLRDVDNILFQVSRQKWQRVEVIFCISSSDIEEQQLTLNPARGLSQHVFRCPSGKPVGYYLNRCIEKARGTYLLRFDADDYYAPDYTHYMICCMRETGAEVISMDLSSYYFTDIDQSYHIRRPLPVSQSGTVDVESGRVGSGSTLCAVAGVFERLKFSETLVVGEDITFYRMAVEIGMDVRLVAGYYHTATRHSDRQSHTWQIDDFNLLSAHARFLGEGCVVPEPGVVCAKRDGDDIYSGLFADVALQWLQDLRMEDVLRTYPKPLRLVVGPQTPIPECRSAALEVRREPVSEAAEGQSSWVFMPDDPAREQALAKRLGGCSVTHDIVPKLVGGNRDVFRQFGGFSAQCRALSTEHFQQASVRYVILCNPRSGSSYLCSLLASMGMGRPAELVREPVATLLGTVCEPAEYLPRVLAEGVRGSVLGTKVISHYLFDHMDDGRIASLFQWLASEGFQLVYLRRPESISSVSAYIADQRGLWHHFERSDRTRQGSGEALEQSLPPYDFNEISLYMKRHLAWSKQLDKLLDAHFPADRVLNLDYHELSADPEQVVQRIAGFIGFNTLPGTIPVSKTRSISADLPGLKDYRARFVAEWTNSLE